MKNFLGLPVVAWGLAKARYNLASEEVAERALNSPRHFCDVGDFKSQEKENWAGPINL